jgi:hypothetical protein
MTRRHYPDGISAWVSAENLRAAKMGASGRFTIAELEALCERFGWRCVGCGQECPLGADHVVPLKKGGSNAIGNIQPMCGSCNSTKRAEIIDLRNRPFNGRDWYSRWKRGELESVAADPFRSPDLDLKFEV